MEGAATQAMRVSIVEEWQRSSCPPAATPLRAAATRPAGCVARSLRAEPGYARRERLAAGLRAAGRCQVILVRTLGFYCALLFCFGDDAAQVFCSQTGVLVGVLYADGFSIADGQRMA